MKIKKKFAILLATIMMTSSMGLPVFAQEVNPPEVMSMADVSTRALDPATDTIITVGTEAELVKALNNTVDKSIYIILSKDITLTKPISAIGTFDKVGINGNGKKITNIANNNVNIKFPSTVKEIEIDKLVFINIDMDLDVNPIEIPDNKNSVKIEIKNSSIDMDSAFKNGIKIGKLGAGSTVKLDNVAIYKDDNGGSTPLNVLASPALTLDVTNCKFTGAFHEPIIVNVSDSESTFNFKDNLFANGSLGDGKTRFQLQFIGTGANAKPSGTISGNEFTDKLDVNIAGIGATGRADMGKVQFINNDYDNGAITANKLEEMKVAFGAKNIPNDWLNKNLGIMVLGTGANLATSLTASTEDTFVEEVVLGNATKDRAYFFEASGDFTPELGNNAVDEASFRKLFEHTTNTDIVIDVQNDIDITNDNLTSGLVAKTITINGNGYTVSVAGDEWDPEEPLMTFRNNASLTNITLNDLNIAKLDSTKGSTVSVNAPALTNFTMKGGSIEAGKFEEPNPVLGIGLLINNTTVAARISIDGATFFNESGIVSKTPIYAYMENAISLEILNSTFVGNYREGLFIDLQDRTTTKNVKIEGNTFENISVGHVAPAIAWVPYQIYFKDGDAAAATTARTKVAGTIKNNKFIDEEGINVAAIGIYLANLTGVTFAGNEFDYKPIDEARITKMQNEYFVRTAGTLTQEAVGNKVIGIAAIGKNDPVRWNGIKLNPLLMDAKNVFIKDVAITVGADSGNAARTEYIYVYNPMKQIPENNISMRINVRDSKGIDIPGATFRFAGYTTVYPANILNKDVALEGKNIEILINDKVFDHGMVSTNYNARGEYIFTYRLKATEEATVIASALVTVKDSDGNDVTATFKVAQTGKTYPANAAAVKIDVISLTNKSINVYDDKGILIGEYELDEKDETGLYQANIALDAPAPKAFEVRINVAGVTGAKFYFEDEPTTSYDVNKVIKVTRQEVVGKKVIVTAPGYLDAEYTYKAGDLNALGRYVGKVTMVMAPLENLKMNISVVDKATNTPIITTFTLDGKEYNANEEIQMDVTELTAKDITVKAPGYAEVTYTLKDADLVGGKYTATIQLEKVYEVRINIAGITGAKFYFADDVAKKEYETNKVQKTDYTEIVGKKVIVTLAGYVDKEYTYQASDLNTAGRYVASVTLEAIPVVLEDLKINITAVNSMSLEKVEAQFKLDGVTYAANEEIQLNVKDLQSKEIVVTALGYDEKTVTLEDVDLNNRIYTKTVELAKETVYEVRINALNAAGTIIPTAEFYFKDDVLQTKHKTNKVIATDYTIVEGKEVVISAPGYDDLTYTYKATDLNYLGRYVKTVRMVAANLKIEVAVVDSVSNEVINATIKWNAKEFDANKEEDLGYKELQNKEITISAPDYVTQTYTLKDSDLVNGKYTTEIRLEKIVEKVYEVRINAVDATGTIIPTAEFYFKDDVLQTKYKTNRVIPTNYTVVVGKEVVVSAPGYDDLEYTYVAKDLNSLGRYVKRLTMIATVTPVLDDLKIEVTVVDSADNTKTVDAQYTLAGKTYKANEEIQLDVKELTDKSIVVTAVGYIMQPYTLSDATDLTNRKYAKTIELIKEAEVVETYVLKLSVKDAENNDLNAKAKAYFTDDVDKKSIELGKDVVLDAKPDATATITIECDGYVTTACPIGAGVTTDTVTRYDMEDCILVKEDIVEKGKNYSIRVTVKDANGELVKATLIKYRAVNGNTVNIKTNTNGVMNIQLGVYTDSQIIGKSITLSTDTFTKVIELSTLNPDVLNQVNWDLN